jgi:hypothetical protein
VTRWYDRLRDEEGVAWLRRAVAVLVVAGALAFVARGADRPANPILADTPTSAPAPTTTTTPPPPGG